MKIPFFKKIWWLWRYQYLQKKAVYEILLKETFRSRSRKSVIVSAPAPAKKGGSGSGSATLVILCEHSSFLSPLEVIGKRKKKNKESERKIHDILSSIPTYFKKDQTEDKKEMAKRWAKREVREVKDR